MKYWRSTRLMALWVVCALGALSGCEERQGPAEGVAAQPQSGAFAVAAPTPAPAQSQLGLPPTAAFQPEFTVIQLNDVYEASPLGGPQGEGGLARVAALRKQLQAQGPVLTLLAGDFLSPSVLGLAKVEGEKLAGRHMVAIFDKMGLDATTVGNHEIDVGEQALRKRLTESKFKWISANVWAADGQPAFPTIEPRHIYELGGVQVGVFGLTIDSNPAAWVKYDTRYVEIAKEQVAALKKEGAEVIIALTHLDLSDDEHLAASVPEIDLVLGGHEHENWQADRGQDFTPVRKADANARTVFVHRVRRAPGGGQALVRSELVRMVPGLPEDTDTKAEIQMWTDLGYAAIQGQGIDPRREVVQAWVDFDGREAAVRSGHTDLTAVISESLQAPDVQVTLYNSGSIRIDDVIHKGTALTEYDVLRILPFGGKAQKASFSGALLARVLDAGHANRGKGGWLQTSGVSGQPGAWQVGGAPLDPKASYSVRLNDYLLTGLESRLDFLKPDAQGLLKLEADGPDVRKLLIERLARGATP